MCSRRIGEMELMWSGHNYLRLPAPTGRFHSRRIDSEYDIFAPFVPQLSPFSKFCGVVFSLFSSCLQIRICALSVRQMPLGEGEFRAEPVLHECKRPASVSALGLKFYP
jgi:hypothetical protein